MLKPSNEKFMAKLYKENKQLMFKAAVSILHNAEDAEDAVHDAFLRVIKNFSKFDTYSCNENASYLVIIVRGIALNKLAARKKIDKLDEKLPDTMNIEETAETDIAYEQVLQNIGRLPPTLKNISTLLWVYHLSERDIAELLDMNISTVRSSASRARKQLKQMEMEEPDNDQ